MKRRALILAACLLSAGLHAQSYAERDCFLTADPAEWAGEKGTRAAWGSTDIRYSPVGVPARQDKTLTLTGWRGETVYAQAVVWTADGGDISFSLSDLRGSDAVIPAAGCEAGFVRPVVVDKYDTMTDGCYKGYMGEPMDAFDSTMVADIIDPALKVYPVKARQTRGIWISCPIPRDVPAGLYKGSLSVFSDGRRIASLPLTVRAHTRTLPQWKDWSYHLDLWINPFTCADFAGVPYWSDAHWAILRPYAERLARSGQKCITATMMHHPWGSGTGTAANFSSMISWIRRADGTWQWDYDIFDRYVRFMMDCGISEQISCYSMAPWNYQFRYYDERTGDFSLLKASPDSPEYEEVFTAFLHDFASHLRGKGWFEKTAIASDERPLDQMQALIKVVRKAEPDFKLALAGFEHLPEIDGDIYDYSLASYKDFPKGRIEQRREAGLKSTFYICCPEIHPNRYIFSDPIEQVYISYNMFVRGADGFLCWAVIHWPRNGVNPLVDGRYDIWYPGESYMLYPGNRTSIRFERLVEGIQDYEKLRILLSEGRSDISAALAPMRRMAYGPDRYTIPDRHAVPELIYNVKKLMNK